MAPRPHAPRRKACQALLPDGTTLCSATFRGWGRYCAPHLEEHARLSGQFKDAAARAERLRAKGELSDKQVRAMAAESVVGRALQRVRAYREALGEERLAGHAPLGRLGDDEDLKGLTVLLASAAGKHITGQWLAVDGGVSAVVGG